MTLSRTARILLAILLLAAAAFFWVNFFTQNRIIGEDPDVPPTATIPPTPDPDTPPVADTPDVDPTVAPPVDVDVDPDVAPDVDVDVDVDPDVDPDVAPEAAVEVPADAPEVDPDAPPPLVVDPADEPDLDEPPVVVIDPPVTVARDLEVAEFPFLITEPPAVPDVEDPAAIAALEAERALEAARATVNPFSPIVVRRPTAPAPERAVPDAPTVTEVPVPDGPPTVPVEPARVATPAPQPLTPAPTVSRDLPRALPPGTPLAATPGLLQETRAIDTIDRPEVPPVTAVRVPEEVAAEPPEEVVRTPPGIVADVPELRGTEPAVEAPEPRAPEPRAPAPPLAAGTDQLARYLRDNGYRFTGSVLGPVSVGVFRSNAETVPQVVALGQTLPNTDIVLTDLRGEQAELTLGDLSQILILDIRR